MVKLSAECVEVVEGGEGRGNRERLDRQGSDVLHSGHQLVGEVGLDAVDPGHAQAVVDKTIVKSIDKACALNKTIVKSVDKACALNKAIVKSVDKASPLDQAIVKTIDKASALDQAIVEATIKEAIALHKAIVEKQCHGASAADDGHQGDDNELHGWCRGGGDGGVI